MNCRKGCRVRGGNVGKRRVMCCGVGGCRRAPSATKTSQNNNQNIIKTYYTAISNVFYTIVKTCSIPLIHNQNIITTLHQQHQLI